MKRRNRLNLDSERVVPPQPTPRRAHQRDGRKALEGVCRTCGVRTPYGRQWCLDHAALHDPHLAEVLERTGGL